MFRKFRNFSEALRSRLYRIEGMEVLSGNRVRFTLVRINFFSFYLPRVLRFETTQSQVAKLRSEGFLI